ncbi:unnamed protein product [marine sediment metagenome]|uniref:Uncharacterized protein n=1 Tax=marine sediment metagenome TaxID=412755 RepID=X1J3K3_9ZZZZ
MKLLVIKLKDTDDLSPFPWGKKVTITDGTATVEGEVVTPVGPMEDPGSVDGIFHITAVEPPVEP